VTKATAIQELFAANFANMKRLHTDIEIRGHATIPNVPYDKIDHKLWTTAERDAPMARITAFADLPRFMVDNDLSYVLVPKWAFLVVQTLWNSEWLRDQCLEYVRRHDLRSADHPVLDDNPPDEREMVMADLLRDGEDNPKLQVVLAAHALGLR
jgi:hypothetical protein